MRRVSVGVGLVGLGLGLGSGFRSSGISFVPLRYELGLPGTTVCFPIAYSLTYLLNLRRKFI